MVISLLAMSSPAAADDGQTFNGGGGQPTPLTSAEIAQARVKSDFAARYFAYRTAGGMPARFPEGLGELERTLNGGKPLGGVTPFQYPAPYSSLYLTSVQYQNQS